MKIALHVPIFKVAKRWSMTFVAEGFQKYVNRPDYTFDIVASDLTLPECLADYDWIISFFLRRQHDYNTSFFQSIRDKFTGIVTGLYCYDRFIDWSVFSHLWMVSDTVVKEKELGDVDYEVMPFGIDAMLFRPLNVEKTLDTVYIGSLAREGQKRIRSWWEPICITMGLEYLIHDGTKNFLNEQEIVKLYNRSKWFMMTASWEGAPIPILEAASCGLPILSTPTGVATHGVVEHKVNGYLCDTEGQFVDCINAFQERPWLVEQMGEKSREIVLRDWDWRVVAEKWMRNLEERW